MVVTIEQVRTWRAAPRVLQRAALVTLVFVSTIIVTGGAVRLSGSGLGCDAWPKCSPGRLIEAGNLHQAIEQINRLVTGLIAVPIIVTIVLAIRRIDRRRDLVVLSSLLFLWLVLEAVLGGVVVKTNLNPIAVAAHFFLGIAGLVVAVVLHRRASEARGPYVSTVAVAVRNRVRLTALLCGLAIALGTVVTGTGPHSGDERAIHRFGFLLSSVARVHSSAVWLFLGALLLTYRKARSTSDAKVLEGPIELVAFAAFFQGAIGYAQYASKLPVALVGVHLLGAVVVTIAVTRLVLAARTPVGADT
jgi:heme a synthase